MIDIKQGAHFAGLFQLGYVASDIEQAMEVFRTRHAVPSFKNLGEVTLPLEGQAPVKFRFALCFVGSIQLEIIEPTGGNDHLYRQVLPASGFGMVLHHFACRVDTLDDLAAMKEAMISNGHEIAVTGGDPKVAKFFYVDTRKTLGHYIEYLYLSPERRAFHAALPHH